VLRKHAGLDLAGEGEVVRKPCERLSGHGSSTESRGERSLEPRRFCLAGAKASCFRTTPPEPLKRFSSTPSLISSFKGELKAVPNFIHYLKAYFWLCIVICSLFFPYRSFAEIIDRIAAVVNEQVITLTDLRIVEEFGFYDKETEASDQNLRRFILEKMIDQKLAIQLSGEQISVSEEELDSSLKARAEEIGSEEFRRKLEEFGMNRDDLKSYAEERIKYQKIIFQRFSQGHIVSLKEMEDYYQQVYLPSQQKKGLEPQPMMDILAEIESLIRQEKIETQVEAWIKNLRKRADIQVYID
jgi:hypothetical protein